MFVLDGLLPVYVATGGRAMLVTPEPAKALPAMLRGCEEQLNDTEIREAH